MTKFTDRTLICWNKVFGISRRLCSIQFPVRYPFSGFLSNMVFRFGVVIFVVKILQFELIGFEHVPKQLKTEHTHLIDMWLKFNWKEM